MEKFLTFRNKAFNSLAEEFDTEIFIISDYEFVVDGALITHIALNENGDVCAIAGTANDDPEFWEYHYEQVALTKSQWNKLVKIAKDMLE